jgi:membrane-bound serine protease (ClpP class)
LLQKLDGRKLVTAAGERTLVTAGANIVGIDPDWKTRFLAVITDPSVALILMMIGMYGLIFEFSNPGFVLPGVVGAMALVIGLFALHLLPVNYAGLALILLGMAFLIAEVFVPSYGTLSIGGIAAFVLGAVLLIDTDVPGFGISIGLIAALAGVTALFALAVSGVALKARRRPVITGREELIGSVGVVLDNATTEGWARVRSERWRVRSAVPLAEGQRVRVTACNGLVLTVTPLPETGEGS